MSKVNKMEHKGFMKLLSSIALKNSVYKQARRKSAGYKKQKRKPRSKNRAVLRPANVRCRYMSVTQDDQNAQQTKDTYSSKPALSEIEVNFDYNCKSEMWPNGLLSDKTQEVPKSKFQRHAISAPVVDKAVLRPIENNQTNSDKKKRQHTVDYIKDNEKLLKPS